MNNFSVGDSVERTYGNRTENSGLRIIRGNRYVIRAIRGDTQVLLVGYQNRYNCRGFKLITPDEGLLISTVDE